nr:trigger factor family protein [Blastocatellia bacterium]
MKSELKETSPTTREIHVEIAPEVVKQSYNKVSQKYASRASVPGFRKGYAPLDVIRLRFKEEIKSEVLQDVVPGQIAEAIAEYNLNPLAEPHLHLDD